MKIPSFLERIFQTLKQTCRQKENRLLYFLLIFFTLLWLPSLFEPISYGDECIYLVLGQAFRQGLSFYRDIHDNKPPLLYLTAALSFGQLPLLRFYNFLWNALHLIIIYRLSLRLTKDKVTSFISSLIFIFLFLIFEGRVANGETFMMMPISLAVYLLLDKSQLSFLTLKKKKVSEFFSGLIIGLLFSLSFLFKVPSIFDFGAVVLVFFFFRIKKVSLQKFKSLLKKQKLWGAICGFAVPVVFSIIYYARKDAFTPYVRSALLQNIGYLSSWGESNKGLYFRFGLLSLITFLFFWQRKKIPFLISFFFIWFIYSLFGALLSARPYPHYLIQAVPSFCFLTALGIKNKKISYRLASLFSLALFMLVYSHFNFWRYPQIPYYRNFFQFISGQKTKNEYYQFWGEKTISNYQLANFIQKSTMANERIFVWGDAACVYATAQRLPPGRYTVNYHIYDFNGFKETLKAIEKQKPKLIIKLKGENRSWPELDNLLQQEYLPLIFPKTKEQIFWRSI